MLLICDTKMNNIIVKSAHVVLNLSNESRGKSDTMRGMSSMLSLFRNEFNKFNNTEVRMLDC